MKFSFQEVKLLLFFTLFYVKRQLWIDLKKLYVIALAQEIKHHVVLPLR